MKYDPALIPQGITESSLTLAFLSGSTWTNIPTTVDTVNKLLIGQTTHFSTYAPTIAAPSKLSYGTLIGNFNGVNVSSNGSPKYVSNSYNTNNTGTYNSGMTWQCVELVNRYYYQTYSKEIRIPGQNANLYYQQASARGLVAYPNGGSVSPQVGDIIVSEGNGIDLVAEANGTDNNVGHVAIVRAVSPDKIHLVEQNWFQNQGDLDHVLAITPGNKVADFSPAFPVKGWLRMPTGGGSAAPPPPASPASPTVILNASPSSIANGATSTLNWSSTNSTSCTSSGGGGTSTVGSFTTPSLTTTTTYTVICTGAGGSASQSATVTVAAPIPTFPYGSALDLSNVSDVIGKIWGPGSNGIVLGGGLNYSTQVGVGGSQQYSGMFVTFYSIQGSTTQNYLTQTAPVSVEVSGPAGAIIEIWDLEILSVIATNYANPGSVVTFTAQPNHRYGGFAWYADNSQKDMAIYAFITPTSVSQGGLTWMPPSSAGYGWPAANTYCANTTIGGLTGWRLPTQSEALALWNSGAMNGHGWEHSLYSQYWTSITSATFSGAHYWFFLFGYVGSNTESYYDTSTLGVVCVR